MVNNFCLITTAAGEDLKRVHSRLYWIGKYLKPTEVNVIVPKHFIETAEHSLVSTKIKFIDENSLINKACFSNLFKSAAPRPLWPRENWYYQQFLKILGAASLEISNLNLRLIWDSDTIPLRPITFFKSGIFIYYEADEYHPPYFDTLARLGIAQCSDRSFIAQSLPTSQFFAKSLISHCGGTCNLQWIKTILAACAWQSRSEFSEYETLGNFQLGREPEMFRPANRLWSRLGKEIFGCEENLCRESINLAGIDFIAFEAGSKERRGLEFRIYKLTSKYKRALASLGNTTCLRKQATRTVKSPET